MFFYAVTFGGFSGLASPLAIYFNTDYGLSAVTAGYFTAAAVLQLAPQRFRAGTGVMTGLVGVTGGVGGFFLASALGVSRQNTGTCQLGLLIFAGLALIALVGLTAVRRRWRTAWGARDVAGARI